MKSSVQKALREPQESFAALAAAVHPAWHQAIIRLANAAESIDEKLTVMMGEPGNIQGRSRDLIESLINFLDMVGEDPDLEDGADLENGADAEPDLGSFDRMTDQSKSWRQTLTGQCADLDAEQDDCDHEDDDPNEAKQQPLVMA
jgi:hypothetical protein